MKNCTVLLLLLFLFSCANEIDESKKEMPKANQSFFQKDNLSKQFFTIDNSKEQSLITQNGSIIKIPINAFGKEKKKVEVYVQEALSSEEILKANLHTQNKNGALSSGGMIHIEVAEGEDASLEKPIEIFVPRKSYNPKMNIYKGEENEDGNITWVDPVPVLGKKKSIAFLKGESIYKRNCASCHTIFKDATGPALYNVQERRPKEWLYKFIKNSSKMIAEGDPYAVCIYNQWSKTAQPLFPNLSDHDIDNILLYIKEESDTRPDLRSQFDNPTSCDSCVTYMRRINEIYTVLPTELAKLNKGYQNQLLKEEKTFRKKEKIYLPNPVYPIATNRTNSGPPPLPPVEYNNPPAKDYFYPIQANTMGWYNIDILFKLLSNTPRTIIATINTPTENMQVSLLVPSLKANLRGISQVEGQYTFGQDKSGIINLPPGEKCFVICVAGHADKRLFSLAAFSSSEKLHEITLNLNSMSKKEIEERIKNLQLNQYEISPYASDIIAQDLQRKKIQEEMYRKRVEEEKALWKKRAELAQKKAAEEEARRKKRAEDYARLKKKHGNNIEKIKNDWLEQEKEIRNKFSNEILLAEHLKPLGCSCGGGTKSESTSIWAPLSTINDTSPNNSTGEMNTGSGADSSSDYQ